MNNIEFIDIFKELWDHSENEVVVNPAKRNVFNLKNEMCKNKEKRNAQNSYTSNKHKSSLFGLLLL